MRCCASCGEQAPYQHGRARDTGRPARYRANDACRPDVRRSTRREGADRPHEAAPGIDRGGDRLRHQVSAWWRRRELNPRPKQHPPRSLRACPGICSRLAAPPDGIRFSQPRKSSYLRAAAPLEQQSGLCDTAPQSAGLTGGSTRDLSPGAYVSTAYAARAKAGLFLAFVNACAVTRAPSARNPEAQLPRRDQTPPRSRAGLHPDSTRPTLETILQPAHAPK